jgi:hypothetical protein
VQKIVVAVLMVLLVLPEHSLAEESKVKKPCNDCEVIASAASVSLREAAQREGLRVAKTLGRPLPQPQPQPQPPGWRNRHPVLFGTLVGLGVGFAGGIAIACSNENDVELPCVLAGPGWGAIGAGVGAAVGFAVSR